MKIPPKHAAAIVRLAICTKGRRSTWTDPHLNLGIDWIGDDGWSDPNKLLCESLGRDSHNPWSQPPNTLLRHRLHNIEG